MDSFLQIYDLRDLLNTLIRPHVASILFTG